MAPEKVSHPWSDGTAVFPSRFQLRFFIPNLKDFGDVSHIKKMAPLPEPVHFAEGDKIGLLGRESPTLEFIGILTGVREGQLWTAKDASEGDGGEPNSYRLYDEARLVKYFHPMEYAASLRDGRSGIVVSIDRYGVATLLIHDRSAVDEQEIQGAIQKRGVTRLAGMEEAEDEQRAASRLQNIGQYQRVTQEMCLLDESWTFDWESAASEAARMGSDVFGSAFNGQKFSVRFPA
jgi:hypothetical protein